MANVQYLTVDESAAGQRIDNFLLKILKGVPKSRIYRVIRSGEVRINKGRVKPGAKLVLGDVVRVPPVNVAERKANSLGQQAGERLLQAIIYQDDDFLVLNKPAGMAVHGGSGVSGGVIETLREVMPDQRFLELVHRLDRFTSGCLMVAKRRPALRQLHAMLREGEIHKTYHALVLGNWPRGLTQVNAPLLRTEGANGERIVKVHVEGKPALTTFKVLQHYRRFSLIAASPVTGRTHQIRVHAQCQQHALAGDEKYGNFDANRELKNMGLKRMFLHAAELEVPKLEGGGCHHFEASLPAELSGFLSVVEKQ